MGCLPVPIMMPGRQLADCACVQSGAQSTHALVGGGTCAETGEMGQAASAVRKTGSQRFLFCCVS